MLKELLKLIWIQFFQLGGLFIPSRPAGKPVGVATVRLQPSLVETQFIDIEIEKVEDSK